MTGLRDTGKSHLPTQPWDYEDVYGGPWYVFREPREEHRLAIKSGPFTILTVGDYFDGGGLIEERLEWICARVNASLEPTS